MQNLKLLAQIYHLSDHNDWTAVTEAVGDLPSVPYPNKMELSAALKVALLSSLLLSAVKSTEDFNDTLNLRQKSHVAGLCAQLIEPAGFPCSEHNVTSLFMYMYLIYW